MRPTRFFDTIVYFSFFNLNGYASMAVKAVKCISVLRQYRQGIIKINNLALQILGTYLSSVPTTFWE